MYILVFKAIYFLILADGSIYDEKYRRIRENSKVLPNFDLENFPDPEKFSSLIEYEQSVLLWKERMVQLLSSFQLPQILGKHYYRPKVTMRQIQVNNRIFSKITI